MIDEALADARMGVDVVLHRPSSAVSSHPKAPTAEQVAAVAAAVAAAEKAVADAEQSALAALEEQETPDFSYY